MATSGRTKQSRLEKLIGKKIKKVKPKHKQSGYIKKLVLKQFELIEDALDRGCDFEDIASVISEEIKRSVSAITLKKYHLANKRTLQEDTNSNGDSTINDFLPTNECSVEMIRKTSDNIKSATAKQSETEEQSQNEHFVIRDMPSSSSNEKNSLEKKLLDRQRQKADFRSVLEGTDNSSNSSLDSNMFEDDEEMAEYNLY
jgi:hypothetical protein